MMEIAPAVSRKEQSMITIYKNKGTELQVLPELAEDAWIHVSDPTPEEITWLESLDIPKDYIVYSLDIDERARVERENGDIFILLRQPSFQGQTVDIPYTTIPLGIILTPTTLITISKFDNEILAEFAAGRVRDLNTAKKGRFVLRLLLATATKYLHFLRQIIKKIDGLEDQLQKSTRNKELLGLLTYQKSLTLFTTALKSNELMIQRLQHIQHFSAYPEDEDLLEDVLAETQQAIEMTHIESDILNSTMDTFASIISNNLNSVMKLLASITIIVSLPNTLAAFFGMNVDIPLDRQPMAFAIILGISLVGTLAVTAFFRRHDWL
jgi:magnesium transporter